VIVEVQPQGLWSDQIEKKENITMKKKNYGSFTSERRTPIDNGQI
jgi:hypothetical protein